MTGLMIATAIGDAYGACFEYCDASPKRPNNLQYAQNTRHKSLKPGYYTDDTQMSLAVLQCVMNDKLEKEGFADAFVTVFQRDPRVGYSRRMQDFIESCTSGADLLSRIHPDSAKSGAAMRSGPLALLPDLGTIKKVARLQARITHNTPGGILSSTAVGMAGFALRTGLCGTRELPRWLSMNTSEDWTQPWLRPVGSQGMDSVRAAISVLSTSDNWGSLLQAGVDLTGDVDTVLAVACGLMSWTTDEPLPEALVNGLENGPFGRDYLTGLDHAISSSLEARQAKEEPV